MVSESFCAKERLSQRSVSCLGRFACRQTTSRPWGCAAENSIVNLCFRPSLDRGPFDWRHIPLSSSIVLLFLGELFFALEKYSIVLPKAAI